MERANRVFCESTLPSHYATLICGRAGASGEVELGNAGHCRPVLVRRAGPAALDGGGIPLGLFCGTHYPPQRFHLDPGDLLILFTDGLSEARNPAEEEYGEERLIRIAGNCHSLSPEAAAQSCLDDMAAFRSSGQRADDLTLMVIQRAATAR